MHKQVKYTTDTFIEKAKKIHGDKYNYSKVNYVNSKAKVCIICPKHGEFWQRASNHLQGCDCPKCVIERTHNIQRKTNGEFVNEIKAIFGDKYDYSKVKYIGIKSKVTLICKKHGEFKALPCHLLQGHSCPKCAGKNKTTDELVNELKNIFKEKYDYSLVDFQKANDKVKIICKKHGVFEATPNHLLQGHGCPKCNQSKLETEVEEILIKNKVTFKYQYKDKWLGLQSLDFYLPDYKIGIECQGIQHFLPVDFAGKGIEWAKRSLGRIKDFDARKQKKCTDNSVMLVYINYDDSKKVKEDKLKQCIGL